MWYGGAPDSSDWEVFHQVWNGTAWSAPVAISASGAASPDLAIDSANNLHVVWHAGGNPEEIYYRKRSSGAWGATTNLSNSGNRSLNPRLAVHNAGTSILVAWHESNQTNGNWDILARPFAGATWQAIENASADSSLSRNTEVVNDASGNFHLAWEDLDTKNVSYRRRNAGGGYGPKTALDTTSGRSFGASLAVAPNGFIHAAWHNDDGDWEILHRAYDGAAWGPITNVANRPDPDHADNTPNIFVDANNQVHISWHDYDKVHYAHTAGGFWRPRYTLFNGPNAGSTFLVQGQNASQLHCIFASRATGRWDCYQTFASMPDTTPSGAPVNLRVTPSNGQNLLDWGYPSQIDRIGIRIRWKTSGFPTGSADGTLLGDFLQPTFTTLHAGLTNGTTYYYSAFIYDAEPNYSSAAQGSGKPTSAPKPNLLVNGPLETFAGGMASGWTGYRVNDPNNAITFASDATHVQTSATNPSALSQTILGIDSASLPASGLSAAGLRQTISGVTPGKVYLFVGYQDIHTSDFGADGMRYVHNFGINVTGGTAPGAPNTTGSIGGALWLTPAQAFWNKSSGGAPGIGGFHRVRAAFVAQSTAISVWTGLTIDNAAVKDNATVKFNADAHTLFEFDFPVEATLQNVGFEGAITDLQDDGDRLPERWLPCGGGIGQVQSWECRDDVPEWRHSGLKGTRIWSRRGTVNAGLMQRVAAVPGSNYTFSMWGKTSGQDGTTMSVGIDPTGAGDINSPAILWQSSTATAWTQLSITATAQASAITVFVRTRNLNTATANYQWSDFDDAQLTGAAGGAVLVQRGSVWKYHDTGALPDTAWRNPGYDDASWLSGPAQLGYGEDDEETPLYDGGGGPKPMTAYFRRSFIATNPSTFAALNLALLRDDGAVVYLNGVEIFRSNIGAGPVIYTTPAASSAIDADETTFFTVPIEPGLLVAGTNVLAVEVHQISDTSSDLSFDFELTASAGNPDADNDGLPDAWEIANFGDVVQNGAGDPDGDGAANAAEHSARTDPESNASRLAISSLAAANGAVTLIWPTTAGVRYGIRFAEMPGAWVTLDNVVTGTGGPATWTDDGLETGSLPASEPQRFYQVIIAP